MEAMSVRNMKIRKSYLSVALVATLTTVLSFIIITACTDLAKAKLAFVHKDPPRPGVVAKIGNEEITEDTLVGEDKKLELFDLKKREYELKMEWLKDLVVKKLVGAEAAQAGISLDDFINKKIVGGDIKISDKEYKKFTVEKRIPDNQITPDVKERIYAYLKNIKKQDLINEYVTKLTKGKPVEVYFKKPKIEVAVEVGQAPVYGNSNAPITVIEFSDFQCPFCSRGAESVSQIKKKYGSQVRIAFRHFPLPMHQQARAVAEASMCVNEQGTEKFWKFHDIAFKGQDKLAKADLEKYAKEAGADPKKFVECFDAKKYASYVQKDIEYGEKIGVKSTPTFFVNGQLVSGALPIDSFSDIINEELEEQKARK